LNKPILKTTSDGSHTLFLPELNEHYHSTFGALQEAKLVFIQNGLHYLQPCLKEINLLEVGFGTGLNALLTVLEAKKQQRKINYVAIEPFPLQKEVINTLNFPEQIGGPEAEGYFNKLHTANWGQASFLSDYFILNKIEAKLQEITLKQQQFHLIYFDAFGPDVQPEMWTEEVFAKLYDCLNFDGVLVTYSCKGSVKRALLAAGFLIEKLPGPEGKREVLRAVKTMKGQ